MRIGLNGCGGMGRQIIRTIVTGSKFKLVAAVDAPHKSFVGKDAGIIAGVEEIGVMVRNHWEEEMFNQCDVILDFSEDGATRGLAREASFHTTPLIVGTFPLENSTLPEIDALSKHVPVIQSLDMSIGMTLLLFYSSLMAAQCEHDIEITETLDAGKYNLDRDVSMELAASMAKARHLEPAEVVRNGRGSMGKRGRHEICVHALRGGQGTGPEHVINFLGKGENIRIIHQAVGNGPATEGALLAAEWIVKQPPGLYTMADVLGLRWPDPGLAQED